MSHIDKLIADLCPNGVEFKRIADVSSKGSKIKWAQVGNAEYQYIDLGAVKPRTRQIGKTQTINSCNAPSRAQQIVQSGDIIFATTRPTQLRWAVIPDSYDGQIVSTGYCVIRPDRSSIITNYLAHTLGTTSFLKYLKANQILGNYPSIPDSRIQEFRIPVPPLEVQREIVRVLDKFTQLEAELEAELEARRRQYEYYRARLFATDSTTVFSPLGVMAKNLDSRRKPVTREARNPGTIPYYGASGVVDHVSDYIFDGDYLLVSEDGANLLTRATPIAFSISGKTWVNNHAHVLEFASHTERRFVELYLNSIDLTPFISGAAQPKLNKAKLSSIPIPNPSAETKERTVQALDKLEAFVNDLSVGLPAELAARRKQYEYYRDQLLIFEEKR